MKLNRLMNVLAVVVLVATSAAGVKYIQQKQDRIDEEAPVIQIKKDLIECSIHTENAGLAKGVTAFDNVDGDLSDQIIISGIRIKDETAEAENVKKKRKNKKKQDSETEALSDQREFEITYVAFDSSNNMATNTRTLRYTDYTSPRFQLKSPMIFESPSAVRPFEYITAEDCIDGNISGQITLEMEACTGFGTYSCQAKVTNSLGDTATLPFTYRVIDTSSEEEQMKPTIGLTDYIVYLEKGETLNPQDYLSDITIDRQNYKLLDADNVEITEDTTETGYGYSTATRGNFMLKDVVNVTSDVNTELPGVYYVRYSFRHPVEDVMGSTELMVIVV